MEKSRTRYSTSSYLDPFGRERNGKDMGMGGSGREKVSEGVLNSHQQALGEYSFKKGSSDNVRISTERSKYFAKVEPAVQNDISGPLDSRLREMDSKIERYKTENISFAREYRLSNHNLFKNDISTENMRSNPGNQETRILNGSSGIHSKDPLYAPAKDFSKSLTTGYENYDETKGQFYGQIPRRPSAAQSPQTIQTGTISSGKMERQNHSSNNQRDMNEYLQQERRDESAYKMGVNKEENERLNMIVQEQKRIIQEMQSQLLEEKAKNSQSRGSLTDTYTITKGRSFPTRDYDQERNNSSGKTNDLDELYKNFVQRVKGWDKIKHGRSNRSSVKAISTVSHIHDSSLESERDKMNSKRIEKKRSKSRQNSIRSSKGINGRSKSKEKKIKKRRSKSKELKRETCLKSEVKRSKVKANGSNSFLNGEKKKEQREPEWSDSKKKQNKLLTSMFKGNEKKIQGKPQISKSSMIASKEVLNQIADIVVEMVGKQLTNKPKKSGNLINSLKKK